MTLERPADGSNFSRRYATGTIRALLPGVETLVITQIFCAKRMFKFSACGAGDRIQPGVERASAQPQEYGLRAHQAREAGGSFSLFTASSSLRLGQSLSPASRACAINAGCTWGSAALHPRLYSAARIRGLGFDTCVSSKNLGNDKDLSER